MIYITFKTNYVNSNMYFNIYFYLASLVSFISSYSEGGFLSLREEITGSYTQGGAFSPALGSRVFSYADDDTTGERNIYDLPDYSEPTSSPAPQVRISIENTYNN